jgi:TRAP-type mannitol/chloroaromatic compound transport system permease small subunit
MSSNVSADQSSATKLLAKADAQLFRVESFFNVTSGMLILFLMFLAVFQEMAMAIFCFLSIAYTQKLGGHVRMELFISRFSGRSLWIVEALGTLIAMWIIAVLALYGWDHFMRAWVIGDSSIDIQIPIWPGKLIVVVAFISLELRLLVQLCGFLRLVVHPNAEPIGVPLVETVDQQAQKEIDAGLAGEKEKVNILGSAGGKS